MQVCCCPPFVLARKQVLLTDDNFTGTGCMAALDAEKFLSEMEDTTAEHKAGKEGNL